MVFVGLCGVSEVNPLNNVTGTEPDVYMGNGWKEVLAAREYLLEHGQESQYNFDDKLQYDKVLRYAYEN